MEREYCFVIQPYGGKYDTLYKDIYAPAIKEAGLEPYRVDNDPAVRDILAEIERKIEDSKICFADLTEDNPNVWYELGYASAIGKDVVMISNNCREKLPFDINHRAVITYKTDSPSDFEELKISIINKIKAFIATIKTTEKILVTPLKEVNEFNAFETTMLALIVGAQIIPNEEVSISYLSAQMNKAGYNEIATGISVRLLQKKGLITTGYGSNYNGDSYPICKLTDKGEDFVVDNYSLFDFSVKRLDVKIPDLNDLPF